MSDLPDPPTLPSAGCARWVDRVQQRLVGTAAWTTLTLDAVKRLAVVSEGAMYEGIEAALRLSNMSPTTQQTRVLPGLHSEMHQYTEKWFTSEKKAATHNLAKEIAKINSRMHDGGQHSIDRYGLIQGVIHPQVAKIGWYVMADKDGSIYRYVGASTDLEERWKYHMRAIRRHAAKAPLPLPAHIPLWDDQHDAEKIYEFIAATGAPPIMIVIATPSRIPDRFLAGEIRPWDKVKESLQDNNGNSTASAIINYMKGKEAYYMNQLRTNSFKHVHSIERWAKVKATPGVHQGLNGSKTQRAKRHMKPPAAAKHQHKRRKMSTPSMPFVPPTRGTVATCVWASLAGTAIKCQHTGKQLHVSDCSKWDTACNDRQTRTIGRQFLDNLSPPALYDMSLTLNHAADAGQPIGGIWLSKGTATRLLHQVSAILASKLGLRDGFAPEPKVILEFAQEACQWITETTFAETLTEVCVQEGIFLPPAIRRPKLWWSNVTPLAIPLRNHGAFQFNDSPNEQCHCKLFAPRYKVHVNGVDGIDQADEHLCTNEMDALIALTQIGATAEGVRGLVDKLSMGNRGCLQQHMTTPQFSLVLAKGVRKYFESMHRTCGMPTTVWNDDLVNKVADRLAAGATNHLVDHPPHIRAMPGLEFQEKHASMLMAKVATIADSDKEPTATSLMCKQVYAAALRTELSKLHYSDECAIDSQQAASLHRDMLEVTNHYAATKQYYAAAQRRINNKQQSRQETGALNEPVPKTKTPQRFGLFRANLKLKTELGVAQVKFRFINNPGMTPLAVWCKALAKIHTFLRPYVKRAHSRRFTVPPDWYTQEEKDLIASMEFPIWEVTTTAEAVAFVRKLVSLNRKADPEHTTCPDIKCLDFSQMFTNLSISACKDAHKFMCDSIPEIKFLVITVQPFPLQFQVQQCDATKAAWYQTELANGRIRHVTVLPMALYHRLYCYAISNSYCCAFNRVHLQRQGVGMGSPLSPAVSQTTLDFYEFTMLEDCIQSRAWKVIKQLSHCARLMDDLLTQSSVIPNCKYMHELFEYVEDTILPPRKIMFAGIFPAFDDAAPGRPEQLKLNLEYDLADYPKFISRYDHEIPFLDISIRWSTKEGLVYGCHDRRILSKYDALPLRKFTDRRSMVPEAPKSGVLSSEIVRAAVRSQRRDEFINQVAASVVELYSKGNPAPVLLPMLKRRLKLMPVKLKNWGTSAQQAFDTVCTRINALYHAGLPLVHHRNHTLGFRNDKHNPQQRPCEDR